MGEYFLEGSFYSLEYFTVWYRVVLYSLYQGKCINCKFGNLNFVVKRNRWD